jgi:hypothetical protein
MTPTRKQPRKVAVILSVSPAAIRETSRLVVLEGH